MSRSPSDFFRPYGKLPLAGRLMIAVLALVTAFGILYALLERHSNTPRAKPTPPPDVAACTAGQSTGCVGSTTQVIITPKR